MLLETGGGLDLVVHLTQIEAYSPPFWPPLRGISKEAETAREGEEKARKTAEQFQYSQQITLAQVAWQDSNMGRLEELLDKCPPDYQHTWEWHYLKRQCHPNALTFAGHDGGVNSMAKQKMRCLPGGFDKGHLQTSAQHGLRETARVPFDDRYQPDGVSGLQDVARLAPTNRTYAS